MKIKESLEWYIVIDWIIAVPNPRYPPVIRANNKTIMLIVIK